MALTVTHAYVSAIPDSGDTTLVQPSHWNANHGLTGVLDVANGGTGIASLATGIATFLGAPTSANLATAVTDETGTGALVFANSPQLNSPTLVTPALGTPTQGILTNCTGYPVGSISGTVPGTAGGTGQTTYAKGDILASPGSNTLNKLPVGTDAFVLTADAASTNGIKWAAASSGGTPAGSGTEIQYRNSTAFGAMAGTAWDNTNRSLVMTGATVTTSNPVLDLSQTWNAGAVAFSGLKLAVTSTASATTSKLVDVQLGGVNAFNVKVAGSVVSVGLEVGTAALGAWTIGGYAALGGYSAIWAGAAASATNNNFMFLTSALGSETILNTNTTFDFRKGNNNFLNITSNPQGFFFTNTDSYLISPATAAWQWGNSDAAAPVSQTMQVQSVVAGTSNTAGQNWTIQGSRGTGTGVGGDIIFKTAAAGTTGTSQNAAAEVLRILNTGNVKFTNAANFSANGSVATVLGSLGPTGSHTAVQKWLTIVDNGAVTGYIPVF